MFKNYLKIAFRNLRMHKFTSIINIVGLAVGLACCILVLLFVQHELSYDRFHENADHIYRIVNIDERPEGDVRAAVTPFMLAPALESEFPEIQRAVRLRKTKRRLISFGSKRFYEDRLFLADSSVFEVFTFRFLEGSQDAALRHAQTIILTEKAAKKYFGSQNPIGKTLSVEDYGDFTVTGVLQNVPENSHFTFDFLCSLTGLDKSTLKSEAENRWFSNVYTYFLLEPNSDPNALESKFAPFTDKHFGKEAKNKAQLLINPVTRIELQPLVDIHLHSKLQSEIAPNSDARYSYALTAVALLILSIACINFVNLTTARAADRTKEIGVRKVLGAQREQLFKQFIGESILLASFAFLVALILMEFLLPVFNNLVNKNLDFSILNNALFYYGVLILILLIGMVSGSYPALVLSAFRPMSALGGSPNTGAKRGAYLRKGLVVFQFVISVFLIVGTLILSQQLTYIQDKNLGFDKEQIVVIEIKDRSIANRYESVKQELLQHPNIVAASASLSRPLAIDYNARIPFYLKNAPEIAKQHIETFLVDYDFLDMFNIKLVAGRDFSREITTDKDQAFIINQAAMRQFGWNAPEEALGREVVLDFNNRAGTIIGVAKDFHIKSLHTEIKPLVLHVWPSLFYTLSVKILPHDIAGTLEFLEEKWQAFDPNHPFEYTFLDEDIDALYQTEKHIQRIAFYCSILAIFIASLGLFGMITFSAQRRTKEIGIRKVLGASVTGIVNLLSQDFIKLVLIANLVAWPVAYLAMNKWLQNFAYRISIEWWVFALAGGLALLIALLTVSAQAIRAALANPVESLRYE